MNGRPARTPVASAISSARTRLPGGFAHDAGTHHTVVMATVMATTAQTNANGFIQSPTLGPAVSFPVNLRNRNVNAARTQSRTANSVDGVTGRLLSNRSTFEKCPNLRPARTPCGRAFSSESPGGRVDAAEGVITIPPHALVPPAFLRGRGVFDAGGPLRPKEDVGVPERPVARGDVRPARGDVRPGHRPGRAVARAPTTPTPPATRCWGGSGTTRIRPSATAPSSSSPSRTTTKTASSRSTTSTR